MRGLLVLFLVLAWLPARAQTVADVEAAWRGWMAKHDRKTGGLAVLRGGKLVHEAVAGRVSAGMPVQMASLSKAVTAVCVAGLIEQGKFGFDTPLAQLLPRTFARLGQPADPRLLQVTVGQLLVHRAGYRRADNDPDPTTGKLGAYLVHATATRTAFDDQMKALLRQKLQLAPGERYAYTNATYLILGAVIEEATGQDYETWCRQSTLKPLGVTTATLDPTWRILASYGGWRMSLADYGRFYQAFAIGSPAIGATARRWMMSPEGKEVGGGAHYGLGTDVRPVRGGANFWHGGRWTFSLTSGFDGPLSASFSTFAVRFGAWDVNYVTYTEPATEGPMRGELDRTMGEAIRNVKTWP